MTNEAKVVHTVDRAAKPARYEMRWHNGIWHLFDCWTWHVYDARFSAEDAKAILDDLRLMEVLRSGMRPSKREVRHAQKH